MNLYRLLTVMMVLACAGCESTVYASAQENQRQNCNKYLGLALYDECIGKAAMPYQEYKAELEALREKE